MGEAGVGDGMRRLLRSVFVRCFSEHPPENGEQETGKPARRSAPLLDMIVLIEPYVKAYFRIFTPPGGSRSPAKKMEKWKIPLFFNKN